MEWKKRPTCGDRFTWWCPMCHCRKSIHNESCFSKSKLSLQTWLQLIHHWSMDMPVTQAAKQAKVSEKRTIDIYQYLRDMCSSKLLATPTVLGGPGSVVQIDESVCTHLKGTTCWCKLYAFHSSVPRMAEVVQLYRNNGYLTWLMHQRALLRDIWS